MSQLVLFNNFCSFFTILFVYFYILFTNYLSISYIW